LTTVFERIRAIQKRDGCDITGTNGPVDVSLEKLAVISALLLVGCSGAQSALEIRGPAAQLIADIWWPMFAAGTVIYLVVAALVLYLLLRRQKSEDSKPGTVDAGESASRSGPQASPPHHASTRLAKRWILLGGVALPVVVLAPLFLASVRTLSALMHDTESALTVRVTGHQWWWEIRYKGAGAAEDVLAANEIHIPAARRVRVEVITADVIHSLWIPNLSGKTDLVPGRTNVMWIEATRPGTSRAQCAEYCGAQHAWMALPVVAESQAAFDDWLARERRPAQVPVNADARIGASVFLSAGCGSCHTIRGTAAGGTAGPDLTHVAGRRTLAAGTLANTRANLARWIADPQAVKPGNKMPRVALSPEQLDPIVTYLRTLH
jgi:cytochrome c oxidase subunit II